MMKLAKSPANPTGHWTDLFCPWTCSFRLHAPLPVAVPSHGTSLPVLQSVHFPPWTGASFLRGSMQEDALGSRWTSMEHLGVPMFLEVLMGQWLSKRGPLATGTCSIWQLGRNADSQGPPPQNQNLWCSSPESCVYQVPGDSEAP